MTHSSKRGRHKQKEEVLRTLLAAKLPLLSPNPALQFRPPPPPHPSAALPAGGSVRALLSSPPSITTVFTLKLSAEEHLRGERRGVSGHRAGKEDRERGAASQRADFGFVSPQTQEHQSAVLNGFGSELLFQCMLESSRHFLNFGGAERVTKALTLRSAHLWPSRLDTWHRGAHGGKREGVHTKARRDGKGPRRDSSVLSLNTYGFIVFSESNFWRRQRDAVWTENEIIDGTSAIVAFFFYKRKSKKNRFYPISSNSSAGLSWQEVWSGSREARCWDVASGRRCSFWSYGKVRGGGGNFSLLTQSSPHNLRSTDVFFFIAFFLCVPNKF